MQMRKLWHISLHHNLRQANSDCRPTQRLLAHITRRAYLTRFAVYTRRSNAMSHSELIAAIPKCYENAKASGDLLFFPSGVHTHEDSGVQFELRHCPALLHKPPLPTPHFDPPSVHLAPNHLQGCDPFAPPYNPQLFVGELKDEEEETEYVIMLNKYSVVPFHFLMVTKEYQSQATPLLPADLVQAYSLILAARKKFQNLFMIYNCGEQSGASQPHKHLQFIPIEEGGPPIERAARAAHIQADWKPFSLPILPFAHHIRRLSISSSASRDEIESALATAFLELLDLAISTVRHIEDHPVGMPSYNVVLTANHLIVVPRSREKYVLRQTGEDISINSMGFAGLLLVKSPEELEAVKAEGPVQILKGVGCESVHDLQVNEGAGLDLEI